MDCPLCGHHENQVYDTRTVSDHVRRRRKCLRCDHRWTSVELPTDKKDKRLETALLKAAKALDDEKVKSNARLLKMEMRLKHLEGEIVELVDTVRAALPILTESGESEER